MNWLIFDAETTGLLKHPAAKDEVQPRIIEWAGVLVNGEGEVLDDLSLLINPGQKLEEVITKITGLTDKDLADEPPFEVVAPAIRHIFSRADGMIAHNLPFDYWVLEGELRRNGLAEGWPWPDERICTVQEFAEEWGRRPRLVELYENLIGKPLDQTHRALDDVMALVEVVRAGGVIR